MTQKGHSHLEVEFINMKRELFNRQDTIYLRGLAIIAIVLHHVFQFTSSKYGVVYPFFLSILLSNLGNMGCAVFFLLSGYGLSCSVEKNFPISISYVYKHLIKLLEPFLFIWLIDTFFVHYLDSISITNLFTLSIYSNQYWFLKEILLLYIIFLCPCVLCEKNTPPPLKMTILPTILVVVFIILKPDSFWWNTTLCFPMGVLCSLYKENIANFYIKNRGALISLSFVLFIISFILSHYVSYFEILRAISFATFVVMIVPYRRYNIKLFEICSTESLKIYIFHVFLLQFYVLQNPIIYFAMVVVGTIMLLVIYNLIERCIALI